MPVVNDRAIAGQAVYTPRMLSVYDLYVLWLSSRFIWKCPSPEIVAHYHANISGNHLDVGVGTGYFLDRCRFPKESPRVALMDMNTNTLAFTSARIARYRPETYQQNILEPLSLLPSRQIEPFDSIGINYLLHCLPGTISGKAVVFDHLKAVMKPGCRIFGSTILHGGVPRGWTTRRLMAFYNRKGIFSNTGDTLEGLQSALAERFKKATIRTVGCVALFSAECH